MKKSSINDLENDFGLVALYTLQSTAQTTFQKTLGGDMADFAYAARQTADG